MTAQKRFIIGRDATTFGRWVRLISGLLFILYAVLRMISNTDRIDALPVLAYFVAILVVYYAAYLVLEKPLLARMNAWVNALVLVVPALVIVFVPVFPGPLQLAMILYWGVMGVLNGVMQYGGCEVVAVPTLVYKRRYDVYCPTNVFDAAEQALTGSQGKTIRPASQDE